MPVPGHVSGLLTVHDQVAVGGVQVVSSGSGSRRKRFRLNRKTPAHLVGHRVHTRPRVWKRLHFSGSLCTSDVDCKRVRYYQQDGDRLSGTRQQLNFEWNSTGYMSEPLVLGKKKA